MSPLVIANDRAVSLNVVDDEAPIATVLPFVVANDRSVSTTQTALEWLPTAETPLNDAAVAYAANGYRVLVVWGVREDGTCQCGKAHKSSAGNIGKHPVKPKWQETATADVSAVRVDRLGYASANVGLEMGGARRLVCLDFDGEKGRTSLAAIERAAGERLPLTLTSQTGRSDGGQHRVFRLADHQDASRLKNVAGRYPGIDVRSENGMIVVAPSRHRTGALYKWTAREEPAVLPDWMFEALASEATKGSEGHASAARAQPPRAVMLPAESTRVSSLERAKLYASTLAPAIQGSGGSATTMSAAAKIARGFALSVDDAIEALSSWNLTCKPPWGPAGLRRKVEEASKGEGERGWLLNAARASAAYVSQAYPQDWDGGSSPPPAQSGVWPVDEHHFERGDHVELAAVLASELGKQGEVIHDAGAFHVYAEGVWSAVDPAAVELLVHAFAGSPCGDNGKTSPLKISAGDVRGCVSCAKSRLTRNGFFAESASGIAFSNGFLRLAGRTLELVPHSPDHRIRYAYDFAYEGSAAVPMWLHFLNGVFRDDPDREDKIACLQQFIGACLLGIATRYARALYMPGNGSNGKSALLAILAALFPKLSTCSVAPQLWENEYRRAEMSGKLLNYVSELPKTSIEDSEAVKAIVSGDPTDARKIFGTPFTLYPKAGHAFGANALPQTEDLTAGFWRRILLLEFNRSFEEDPAKDEFIADKIIAAERSAIIVWALAGVIRLIESKGYTLPASHLDGVKRWRSQADQVSAFVDDCCSIGAKVDNTASALYQKYTAWAERNGHRPVSSTKFGTRLQALGHKKHETNKANMCPLGILVTPRSEAQP